MNCRSGEADNNTFVASVHTFPPVTLTHENIVSFQVLSFLQYNQFKFNYPKAWEICMQVRKQQLELDMEQQTGSK